jgi:uridine kinase
MKPQFVIIRGVACSGKSTIADRLRELFQEDKVAIIHTEIFYYGIVRGDNPKIAMENTKRILDNYLENKYTVILEGTLSFRDSKGKLYVDTFVNIAKRYKIPIKRFFFVASLEELKKRERKRNKISLRSVKKFYNLALKSVKKDEIIIDTTNKSILQVLKEIKKELF